MSHTLAEAVKWASSSQWQETNMVITGGVNDHGTSTLIQIIGDQPKTYTMELGIKSHCMVNLINDTYLLIGGNVAIDGSLVTMNKTFIVTLNDEGVEWKEGPEITNERDSLMCGIMTEEGGSRYAVVVGGIGNQGSISDLCQYLELPDLTWKSCSNLPKGIAEGQLITDPESGDLILLGGRSSHGYESTILRLSSINDQWIVTDVSLVAGRTLHTSMFVPDDQLLCENTKSKHDEL